jgi:hypothetical protein
MKRFGICIFAVMMILGLTSVLPVAEGQQAIPGDQDIDQKLQAAIQAYLKEKTLSSGTLDIYDDTLNAVRNLRTIEPKKGFEKDGENYVGLIDYRDISTGAIVTVAFTVKNTGSGFIVEGLEIKNVAELSKSQEEADENKTYSDAEVQEFMRNYVEKQSKFTDYIFLFDEERNTMRKLKLVKLKDEVRRMGIMSVSTGEFKDTISGEMLTIDMSVMNKKGKLRIQNLLIRKVYNPQPPA